MSSIRKWIASKMFPPITSSGNSQTNGSSENGLPFFRSFSRNSTPGSNAPIGGHPSSDSSRDSNAEQSYFCSIYSHYHSGSTQNSHVNDKHLVSDMYQFYYANEDLNYISSELDTFDGRKDTDRCSALVNNLKLAQDRVITLIFRIMDEIGCERATREYRLKFPDELLAGEGIESLNSQIWFGAECLAAGSTITNNQAESNYLRPIANNLTATLEQIRYDLRSCCDYLPKKPKIAKDLIRRLENFDRLFTSFEYDYVKAMLPIKSAEDIESLQELTFLFSETLSYSLKRNLILKDDVDGCQPSVMIALPRLSIVRGLLHGYGSVVCKLNCDDLSSILKPFHSVLLKFHELLINLNEEEIDFLEQLLSNNYQNNDLSLNDDILYEYANNQNDLNDQSDILNYYNKFMKCAKRYGLSSREAHAGRVKYSKASLNKYISSSVDLLLINNKNEDTNQSGAVRYSPLIRPQKMMLKSLSMPNLNVNYQGGISSAKHTNLKEDKQLYLCKSETSPASSTFPSTNSSLQSSSSNSYPNFSLITSSSSASSLSNEVDFMNQFKEILKRSHKSSIAKHRSNGHTGRPLSSNGPLAAYTEVHLNDSSNQRSMTTTGLPNLEQVAEANFDTNLNLQAPTPAASAFSNNSIHIDLETIHFDELSQLKICKKKILHQVFVMISKIADKFQTNYASELRNILRTVFLLQDIEESNELLKNQADLSFAQSVNVQLAHYSSDNADLDIVEEGIDANDFLLEQNNSVNLTPSTSQASPQAEPQNTTNCENCDTIEGANCVTNSSSTANFHAYRSNSFEDALNLKQTETFRGQRSSTLVSSSYPSIKDSTCSSSAAEAVATSGASKVCSRSLPSLVERNAAAASVQPNQASSQLSAGSTSSTTSLSSGHSPQQSQFTVSTATTVDERYDLPTFFLPHTDSFNSSSYFAHSMMPISENVPEPSSSATRNLLLPPTWIPDELVNTCSMCAQVFNLIRRRHHCRRCGNIFCHQCSNNFISLKCFGYAKPVRVCNRCLVLHEQQSMNQHVPSTTSTTSYGA